MTIVEKAHELGKLIKESAEMEALKNAEKAQAEDPWPEAIHRIEHAGLVTEEQAIRMGKLGMVPSTQPEFLYLYGDGVVDGVGPEKGEEFMPMARFKKSPARKWL